MERIIWEPTLATLDGLITAAPELRKLVVLGARVALEVHGIAYEQTRLRLNGTNNALDNAETAYAAELAAWTPSFIAPGTPWAEANRAVRAVERDQVEILSALQLDPTVYTVSGYGTRVLAPTVDTPFTGDGLNPADAFIILMSGTTRVLRIPSRIAGVMGNAIKVQVLNASNGRPECFDLRVTLGAHENYYPDLDATARNFAFGDDSLLIQPAVLLNAIRPDNVGPVFLTGGGGSATETLNDRASSAKLLPAVTVVARRAIDLFMQRMMNEYQARPSPPAVLVDRDYTLRTAELQSSLITALQAIDFLQAP